MIHEKSIYVEKLKLENKRYFFIPKLNYVKRYISCIKRIMEENDFDYIWINNTSKVNVLLLECANKNKISIIMHSHGTNNEEKGIKKFIFSIVEKINSKRFYSLIDIPFSCSKDSANYFYGKCQELRDRVVIINNGIKVSEYKFEEIVRQKVRYEVGLKEEDIALTMIGRLTVVKNQIFSLKLLKKLDDKFKLVLFGDGEDRELLEKFVMNNQLSSRVFFMGMRKNVSEYLNGMDVFLLPSLHEGIPFSIIEAQANGISCIVSDRLSKELAVSDLVSFCDIKNYEYWIEKICSLNLNYKREQYYKIVKANGFSIEQSADKFMKEVEKFRRKSK